jgi:hypothetical protein
MKGKRAVLVLGMHRSGTSAISRFVNMLGFDLGEHLMEAREDNPKGFWENSEIIRFNEELMSADGIRWDSIDPNIDKTIDRGLRPKSQRSAHAIIQKEFSSDDIVIKDPRMCRLLPVWQKLLADLEFDVVTVLVIRDPTAVARSLEKRDMMPTNRGLLLWLLYTFEVLDYLVDPPILVDYDLLMQDADTGLASLRQLNPARYSDCVAQYNDEFLSSELYHHAQQPAETALAEIAQHIASDLSSVDLLVMKEQLLQALVAVYTASEGSPENQRLYDELSSAKAHSAQLDLERAKYDEYVADLSTQNREMEGYAEGLISSLEEKDEYVTSLTSSLEEKDEYVTSLTSSLEEKDEYVTSLTSLVEEKNEYIDSLQSALDTAENHSHELQDNILGVSSELEEVRSHVEENMKVNAEYVTSLTSSLAEKDEYINSLQSALDTAENHRNELQDNILGVSSELEEVRLHIEENMKVNAKYVTSLTSSLAEKDEYIDSLQSALDDTSKHYAALEKYTNSLKTSLADRENHLGRLQAAMLVRIATKLHGIKRDQDE